MTRTVFSIVFSAGFNAGVGVRPQHPAGCRTNHTGGGAAHPHVHFPGVPRIRGDRTIRSDSIRRNRNLHALRRVDAADGGANLRL